MLKNYNLDGFHAQRKTAQISLSVLKRFGEPVNHLITFFSCSHDFHFLSLKYKIQTHKVMGYMEKVNWEVFLQKRESAP